MVVVVNCKHEEDPIESVHNIIYTSFSRRTTADHSGIGGGICPKFELTQAFMHVLITCKNEDERGIFPTLKGS